MRDIQIRVRFQFGTYFNQIAPDIQDSSGRMRSGLSNGEKFSLNPPAVAESPRSSKCWQSKAVVQSGIFLKIDIRAVTTAWRINGNKRVFGLVKDFGTSQSPKSTRPLTISLVP
ncbi:hypothetical protein, partial [Thiolapillus sp.]|uniref:hypothetical protein n=1 Tax=Thiolapillus sp. TaxID=2017437 RepID=UPI003AF7FE1C